MPTKKRAKAAAKKKKSGPCWTGYERTPGTKQGTKGSCRKK